MNYVPGDHARVVLRGFMWGLIPTALLLRVFQRAVEEEVLLGRLVDPTHEGDGPWHVCQQIVKTARLAPAYAVRGPGRQVAGWLSIEQATAIAAALNAIWVRDRSR